MPLPSSFRISCQSDPYEAGKDYVGFIVWDIGNYRQMKDAKNIRNGYVVIYESAKACSEHPGAGGQVHGAGVKKFFGYSCSTLVNKYQMVFGGFAVRPNGVKTKSCTLNIDGTFGKECQMFEANAAIIHEICRRYISHGPAHTYIRSTQSKVLEVKDTGSFEKYVNNEPRVIFDFYADWCPPCKMIAPCFAELATQYPDIKFVKVDAMKFKFLAKRMKVKAFPHFKIFVNGKNYDNFEGCDFDGLRDKIIKLNAN